MRRIFEYDNSDYELYNKYNCSVCGEELSRIKCDECGVKIENDELTTVDLIGVLQHEVDFYHKAIEVFLEKLDKK